MEVTDTTKDHKQTDQLNERISAFNTRLTEMGFELERNTKEPGLLFRYPDPAHTRFNQQLLVNLNRSKSGHFSYESTGNKVWIYIAGPSLTDISAEVVQRELNKLIRKQIKIYSFR